VNPADGSWDSEKLIIFTDPESKTMKFVDSYQSMAQDKLADKVTMRDNTMKKNKPPDSWDGALGRIITGGIIELELPCGDFKFREHDGASAWLATFCKFARRELANEFPLQGFSHLVRPVGCKLSFVVLPLADLATRGVVPTDTYQHLCTLVGQLLFRILIIHV